jgi:hypothetical protein
MNCIDWRDNETANASRDGAAAQNRLLFATYLTHGNPGHVKNSQPLPDSEHLSFYFRVRLSIGMRYDCFTEINMRRRSLAASSEIACRMFPQGIRRKIRRDRCVNWLKSI